jgi:hypothetical protein
MTQENTVPDDPAALVEQWEHVQYPDSIPGNIATEVKAECAEQLRAVLEQP